MESKMNYAAVGAFVLGFLVFMAAFLIWVSGIKFTEKPKVIDVVFTRVSGLKEGGSVRYQGLHVGTIKGIRIDEKNPKHIMVRIEIEQNVPLKTDMMATIEAQGITGTSYIQLIGGSERAPNIKFSNKQPPQIIGKDSSFDKVLDSAPNVISDFSSLTEDIRDVVNAQNRKTFGEILLNIKALTDTLREEGDDGSTLTITLSKTLTKFNAALDEIEKTAKEIRQTFSENRSNIKVFTGSGLTLLTKFLDSAKETLETFKRVSEALERSPARFFHNDPDRGVRLRS